MTSLIYFSKLSLVGLWMVIATLMTLIKCLWRWGDPSLLSEWSHLYAWGALPILGIKIDFAGAEHMEAHQPCVYMFNHQSGIDLVTIGLIAPPRTVTIAKREILFIPILGLIFLASRSLMINRKNQGQAHGTIADAARRMRQEKLSVGIAPEGTRNRINDDFLPFKKGGFHLAIEAQVPIVPVISGPLRPLFDHEKRHSAAGTLQIRALAPYSTLGKTRADLDQIVVEVKKIMEDCYYSLKTEVDK